MRPPQLRQNILEKDPVHNRKRSKQIKIKTEVSNNNRKEYRQKNKKVKGSPE